MPSLRKMLPSSNALFVFEAAARCGSFTKAAAELNVTQPAVSRMLARLEQHLEIRLFERTPSGIALTDDGKALYRCVSSGFQSIETTITELRGRRSGSEPVTLSLSTAFTTHWLMPRIHLFQQAFPKVDLRFQLITAFLQGPVTDVDLGMRFLEGGDEEHAVWFFTPELLLPVCSPGYLERQGSIEAPRADTRHTLIHLNGSGTNWAETFEELADTPVTSLSFSDYAVVLQGALQGQGIALGWLNVVSHWLKAGQLVPAASRLVQTNRLCQLVASRRRPLRPVVTAIRDWLLAEIEADFLAIDQLYPELKIRRR